MAKDFTPALDAAQNQLDLTLSAADTLDTKALAVLGFVVALFIFALQSEMHNQWWLLAPLFLAFGISTVLTIMVIWPRDYEGAAVDFNDHPEYFELEQQDLVLQLLANTQAAIVTNSKLNLRKSTHCGVAIAAALVGVCFLIGCIL